MATTKKKAATETERWSEDEFGVVSWHGYKQGDAWHAGGHEPFARMLDVLNKSPAVPRRFKDAAIHVHDDLEVARSIAVSLFGKHWREHVMDVYDRMQSRAAQDGGEAE
jgi:hypothetical protein